MSENRTELELLLARIKHLEKLVSAFGKLADWEMLKDGDSVVIDNPDSLSHGKIGKFRSHEWSSSGFCELIVQFSTGKSFAYSPTQVKVAAQTSEPTPTDAKKTIFRTQESSGAETSGLKIIEAKLAQLAKIPKSARLSVLSSTLDKALLEQAKQIAKSRGII